MVVAAVAAAVAALESVAKEHQVVGNIWSYCGCKINVINRNERHHMAIQTFKPHCSGATAAAADACAALLQRIRCALLYFTL